ncbi:hypothetical protein [Streptomyces sp. NPDC014734]|uniref:hypothetical protein n=1 Tax=Streptomyces sp. NPDC014734 TaxID=3364886 RepID=UPI0036FB1B61
MARNWCTDAPNGTKTTTKPKCSSDGVKQAWDVLQVGDATSSKKDWDTFQVDAHWCYNVWFDGPGPLYLWRTYSQAKSNKDAWVKVSNGYIAHVWAQKYGSCPE